MQDLVHLARRANDRRTKVGAKGEKVIHRNDPRLPLPLETSMPGVFAAGDVRYGSVKRVASAVGAGAIAIQSVHEYLNSAAHRVGAPRSTL